MVKIQYIANTDGLYFKFKREYFDRIDYLVSEWEDRTKLDMEFTYYKKMIQKDVNNYIAVDYDGNISNKGLYVKKLSSIDYDLPIVNKAIKDNLLYDVPVKDTIMSCDKLIDFQKIVRMSNKFRKAHHNGVELQDQTFRVFASKDENDGYIGRDKYVGGTVEKFANTPEHCFIINDDITNMEIPDKLDKQWYVDLSEKRIFAFI